MQTPLRLGFKFFFVFFLLLLIGLNPLKAQLSNVAVTGFNNDIIANGVGSTNTVSTGTLPGVTYPTIGVDGNGPTAYSLVDNTYKWYSASTAATCGVPTTISSAVTAGLTYNLQSASSNNALTVTSNTYSGNPFSTSGTVSLSTPASYTKLFVLYETVLNTGSVGVNATVTFTDATSQVFSNNAVVNWFTNTSSAYTNLQRAQNSAPGAVSGCGVGPYLFEMGLTLNPANYGKQVASITFSWTNAVGNAVNTVNYLHVMAIGGLTPCVTPIAQATLVSMSATSSSQITGSFNAASGSPSGYLVVRYPNGASTTNPVNGVAYSANQTIGLGTVIQSGATTTFTASGLTGGTNYDFYVYSFNTGATCGGPIYNTSSALLGSQATTACSGVTAGTYSVGPTGTYSNLTAALTALSAGATGPVILELQAAYSSAAETFPLTFPLNSCLSATNSLTIRPATGATALTITSANTTGTINFNGANYVTIDGRPGGTGSTSQLTIANTNAGASYAVNFANDASYNTIRYCTITSRNTSITSGTISFGLGTTTGNDFNTIDNCTITDDASGSFPVNAIYSLGTSAAVDNNNITISNCNIANYFSAGTVSAGIFVSNTNANSSNTWLITNNKFYQTAIRVFTSSLPTLSAITVAGGAGFTISNNTIGYSNAAGTGYTSLIGNSVTLAGFPTSYAVAGTATATRYTAINCAFATAGSTSYIVGNTIAGLALYTSSGATTTYGILCGIQVTSGNVNIGVNAAGAAAGNTIGSTSSNGSLYAATTTTGGTVVGIYVSSANTVNIQNNNLGGIDASGTSATLTGGITGIDVTGAGAFTISNNNIGAAGASNIRNGFIQNATNLGAGGATLTSSTGATSALVGIRSTATGNLVSISSNVLRNWATSGTVTACTGILTSGTMSGVGPTVSVTSNSLGTATSSAGAWMTYTVANSGALIGISVTNTVAINHTVRANDFRGIVYAVAGTNALTFITCTGGTSAGNLTLVENNTFTNLSVNTTGAVTFISHGYSVASSGVQTINNNSIATGFTKTGASGNIVCMTSGTSSAANSTINHTNNNFSNITCPTAANAIAITGISNSDGATSPFPIKTITGNVFNNWNAQTTGTGALVGMTYSYIGNGTNISNNTVTALTGGAAITGITVTATGTLATNNLSLSNNIINNLTSAGTGGNVIGLSCSNTGVITIGAHTINNLTSSAASASVTGMSLTGAATCNATSGLTINTLNATGATSPTVYGLSITGGTTVNVAALRVYTLSNAGATTPLTAAVNISGGTTVNLYQSKIYDILSSGAFAGNGGVNGVLIAGGTTVNLYNNLLGDLRATNSSSTDAIRAISVTSTAASASYNIFNNSVHLNASSSNTSFGSSAIYHASSTTATTAALDLRNNILINNSTPGSVAGNTVVIRRAAAAQLQNYSSNSNNNFLFGGTAAANRLVYFDGTNAYQTMSALQTAVAPRESASFTDAGFVSASFFQSTAGSNANFLNPIASVSTQCESGATLMPSSLTGYTLDYSGATRNATTPDVGAWEFVGVTPSPSLSLVSLSPLGNQCTATSHTVSATITTPSGSISTAVINYAYNGVSQTAISMTNTSGNIWTASIPAPTAPTNATVTWSILATSSAGFSTNYSGTTYNDEPLFGYSASVLSSANPICSGSSATLSTALLRAGTATVGAGATTISSNYPDPFYSLWSNTHNQYLITAAELNALNVYAGNITSLGIQLTAGTLNLADVSIKMANTTATSLTTFQSPVFTTVFTAATYTRTIGLNTFTFTAPFNWDGVSNVLIEFCHGNSASSATMSSGALGDNTAYVSCIHTHKSAASAGSATCTDLSTNLTTYSQRPRFTFGAQLSVAATSILWNTGATTASISVSPTTSTTYSTAIVSNGCTLNSSTFTETVLPSPSAPTATNSTQCGIGIPTASVSSTTAASAPQFFWYSASTSGTVLQAPPVASSLSTYYSNNFSSATLSNSSLAGSAAIASGILTLQSAAASLSGGLTVNPSGINSTMFQTDFDVTLTATGTTIADGFSYSFADDANAASTTPTAERGSGSKFKIGFMTYNAANGADGKGIYLMYNNTATTGYTAATPGVLGYYSTNLSWIPTAAGSVTSHVTVSIDAAGLCTVTLTIGAGAPITIFNNVSLGASYLAANKSTWKHVFQSRSGGIAGGYALDNVVIQANTYGAGSTSYNSSISTPTTFYVVEKDPSTGCESAPRTAVVANVTYGDTVRPVARVGSTPITSLCIGSSFTLGTAQTGPNSNAYNYTITVSPSAGSGLSGGTFNAGSFASPNTTVVTPTVAGTYVYTVTYSDGLCNGSNTMTLVVSPYPSNVTATSSGNNYCGTGTFNLTGTGFGSSATPLSEGFETFPLSSFAVNTITAGPYTATQNSTYASVGSNAVLFTTTAVSSNGALTSSNNIDLSAYSSAVFSFKQICAMEGPTTSYDYGYPEYSTNGGTTWNSFPASSYTGTGTLMGTGTVGFSTRSYANWIAAFTSSASLPNNTLWQTETYNVPVAALTSTQFKVRFRYTTDGSTNYYGWLIDDVKILATTPATFAWTSAPSGLTSATQNVSNVTATTTTTYTVTATNAAGCQTTANTTVTIIPIPSAPTASAPSTQCGFGIPTASVSTSFGTSSPTFKWYANATGGTALQSSTSTTYSSAITATTTFYVTEANGACESSPRTAVVANVTQPDTIAISGNAATCFGTANSLSTSTITSSNGNVYTSYTWSATPSTGSGVTGSPTGSNQSFTATAAGNYVYTVVAFDPTLNCYASANFPVSVYSNLTGSVTATQITGCTNPTGLITANVSGAGTIVNNDFSSSVLPSNMTSAGNDFAITGGRMQLTSAANSKNGGVIITNTTGLANNDFQIDFDMITTSGGVSPADGFSYSYGDDVVALPSATAATGTTGVTTLAPENGSGTKLKLSFDAINNTGGCTAGAPASNANGNTSGIYLMYNCTTSHQGPTCPGVIYHDGGTAGSIYSNGTLVSAGTAAGLSWRATTTSGANTHVTIKINALGQISMWLNNVQVVNNQQLPASYLSANKANWKHAFCARTGGLNEGHYIDNLVIQYNNFYEYSINGGASWTTTNPIVPSGPGTYSVDARYVSVPSCQANLGSVTINTPSPAAVTDNAAICTYYTSTPNLSFSPSFTADAYQWSSSPSGANTFTPITGATAATYTPSTFSTSLDYKVELQCGSPTPTTLYTSAPVTVNAVTPSITSTNQSVTPCGVGTATLTANGNAQTLAYNWYAAATGGSPLQSTSSNSFVTPSISANTTYYVAASAGGSNLSGGKVSTNGADGTNTTGGIYFTANNAFTLQSVKMYPTGAGTNTIVLYAGSTTTGTAIYTTTYTFTGANSAGVTVPLNWAITPGTYTIYQSVSGASCWRDFSGGSSLPATAYPYNIGSACTLTDATLTGYYYFFYNWTISTGCESPRTAVVANVTAAPSISVTNSNPTICGGQTSTIAATSSNSNYSYSWTPGSLTGASQLVSPTPTTSVQTVNTYTVTATDAGTGCVTQANTSVTVNPNPTPVSVSPVSPHILYGTPQQLTATGGTNGGNLTATWGTGVTQNTTTSYPAPFSVYYGAQRMQMLVTATDLAAMGILPGMSINSIRFPVVSLGSNWGVSLTACNNFAVRIGSSNLTAITSFQTGLTQVVAPSNYTPTVGYNNNFNFATPYSYAGGNIIIETTFGNNIAGTINDAVIQYNTATSYTSTIVYRADNVTSAAAATATTVSLSYSSRADFKLGATNLITNPFYWTPAQSLFMNANASTAYAAGGAANIVFANPHADTVYTITATNLSTGCTSTTKDSVFVEMPPANYNCANATPLTITPSCNLVSGTSKWGWYNPAAVPTTPATPTTATCGNADDDVWYSFVRPAGMTTLTVRVVGSSNYDPAFEIVTGACGATQTVVACVNNLTTTNNSIETYTLNVPSGAAAATYYVRVYDARTGFGSGDFDICVYGIVPPPLNNDPCGAGNFSSNLATWGGATTILAAYDGGSPIFMGQANNSTANPPTGVNLVYFSGSTAFANNLGSNEPTPPCGNLGSNAKTVWFKFKAPTIGGVDVTLRSLFNGNPTNFSTIIAAYAASVDPCTGSPTYTNIACATTGVLSLTAASTVLAPYAGQYIYVQLAGNGASSPVGNYMLSIQAVPQNIALSNPTTSSLTVTLPTAPGTSNVSIQWRSVGSTGYSLVNVSPSVGAYTITGLTSGVNYQVWAKYYNNSQAFYTNFATLGTTIGCSASPAAPNVVPVANHCSRDTITWFGHPLATGAFPYRLYWKQAASTGGYSVIAVPSSAYNAATGKVSVLLTNLAVNTTYQFYYRVLCAGGAQIVSGIATYTQCNGPAKMDGTFHGSFEHNGRYFVDADFVDVTSFTDNTPADGNVHEVVLNEVNDMNEVLNGAGIKVASNGEENGAFELIPNPTSDNVFVEYNLANAGRVVVRVMNIQGKVVKEEVMENSGAIGAVQIDLSDVQSGVYMVSVDAPGYKATKRLVVTK